MKIKVLLISAILAGVISQSKSDEGYPEDHSHVDDQSQNSHGAPEASSGEQCNYGKGGGSYGPKYGKKNSYGSYRQKRAPYGPKPYNGGYGGSKGGYGSKFLNLD